MKIYNFTTFLYIKSTIFHTFCPITPQFSLSFRKGMPHTTKYYKSRKMQYYIDKTCKKCQLFSLKFHDFLKSMHY